MRQIADLHIHSRFSRACSKELTLANIDKTCRTKGVDIIATGDFTFPDWFSGIKNELEEIDNSGLYKLKAASDDKLKFLLSTELALIYKKYDKCRRIHIVVHAPNIEAVQELNNYLDKKYNIRSDGRPILGMGAEELCKLCFSIHPKFLIYPAHIWTPWFAVFGSKSGFDKMEECFGKYTKNIYAYETGLSSDPEMNWRLSALDKLTLLSNSDAHSLPNIAREANVFELQKISYDEIYNVVKNVERPKLGVSTDKNKSFLDYTIEFYPEEGMYHLDGHRACGARFTPEETKKHKGICPVCKKPLVIGVMYRVDELADRPLGFKPNNAHGYKKLVELDKIIAEALDMKSRTSKRVQAEYQNIIRQAGTEMTVLLDLPLGDLFKMTLPSVVEGVKRVREGNLHVEPGFDGQYGMVNIFNDEEKAENKQGKLF
ncbi:MAG: endonuclease Q family protein [candidate division Zixibacteria bacterium]|nr:endonuclease Q family protein [candidate division Zixibacteria bacterium]